MSEFKKMNFTSNPPASTGEYYLVKNKDKVLGVFQWLDSDRVRLKEDYSLPSFISLELRDWLVSRTPPKHREHMQQLLHQLGLMSLRSILDFSKGLTLTDTLWVVPEKSNITWREVSLFTNNFDEVIAHMAFDGGLYGIPLSTTSPELGTAGMLAKCWVRNSAGQISLVKTGTTGASNAGNEPYSENLAHQVLSRLGYAHVPYTVSKYRGRLVSACPILTSEQEMLLPVSRYYDFRTIDKLVHLCIKDGVSEGLTQHLIFDYLSWNTDRHAGNLGVILDADTFQLIKFAPIFDNGVSMLNYWNGIDDLDDYVTRSTPALYDSFEYGAQLGKEILGNKHNVQRLIGFKFDRSQVKGYPDKRIDAIERGLQERVRNFFSNVLKKPSRLRVCSKR